VGSEKQARVIVSRETLNRKVTSDMTDTVTVEIPEDVRDNSETVTDYAFMRHRSPDGGRLTPADRDRHITWYKNGVLMGNVYSWHDVNPNGQRCRFDMIVNGKQQVTALMHTEYFTRVACYQGEWCPSYAAHYVATTGGTLPLTDPVPVCDHHIDRLRKSFADSPVTLHLSERLLIGQHD
jgi:hypothetical protein